MFLWIGNRTLNDSELLSHFFELRQRESPPVCFCHEIGSSRNRVFVAAKPRQHLAAGLSPQVSAARDPLAAKRWQQYEQSAGTDCFRHFVATEGPKYDDK